ncbi:MAG: DegT/DnrJ/EryC1/StrS family aminotransferase [Bacilli bacterium]|nr:DegT/DnrJ/EryC1/StrS family aminotransferase [Bacilli bacterium]
MSKILVTQSSMPEMDEYVEEIKDLWESKWLTNNGSKHQKLEKELCEYLDVSNTTLFCNGHQALIVALNALDLKGEVITTPFTFASTTHAIVQNGLKPVFCDINDDDYTIDVSKIESLITDKTCAIMPVHVYGSPCDVYKIEDIAKKHNLKVIYDAAHAFGVTVDGKGIGNFGDISMFSFHATKVFNTIEGGGLTYSDKLLENKLNVLKNFGITSPETVDEVGTNAKMNEFCAAMGLCNLKHVDAEIEKRKKVYERYVFNLKDVAGIKLISYKENVKPNYAYFPVVFDKEKFGLNRDEVYELLLKNDIFTRKYFYPLINDFGCYKSEYSSNDTPVAKEVASNVLTLPMYADLKEEEIDRICNIIKEVK